MRVIASVVALLGLSCTGCDLIMVSTKPTSTVPTSPATPFAESAPKRTNPTTTPSTETRSTTTTPLLPSPPPTPAPTPLLPPKDTDPPPETEEPEGKPEELPDVPRSDPKSVLKELNKEKTFYLESRPDNSRRIMVVSEVVLRQGLLEVLLCKKDTKEHESILRTSVDAKFLHAALIAIGGKVGKPVQFLNPKTQEVEYRPATGGQIRVGVVYKLDGKVFEHAAQEWIIDKKTKKPMTHQWVFAGSRFLKNPDMPDQPEYYTANNGEVISLANFIDSMLELPVQISRESTEEFFHAATKRIPPLRSKVWVTLEAAPEKK